MRIKKFHFFFFAVMLSLSAQAFASSFAKISIKVPTTIRDGKHLLSAVDILINKKNIKGKVVFGLHGFVHTAKTFENLVERMFSTSPFKDEVSIVVLLNLPKRNGSTTVIPYQSLRFEELNLTDYTEIVVKILDRLDKIKLSPDMIIGHSMGALLVQSAQTKLLNEGRDFHSAYGTDDVILLGSSIPEGLPWALLDTDIPEQILGAYSNSSSALGQYISIPSEAWVPTFFGNFVGAVDPQAPTPAEANARGYIAMEPMNASLNLVGLPPFNRLSVVQNAFSADKGIDLRVVNFSNDTLTNMNPADQEGLYNYLTGDASLSGYYYIEGEFMVHDAYISRPESLDSVLTDALN